MGKWCVILTISLSLPGTLAWGDSGNDRANHLCSKAEAVEREAKEAERKSAERQRFLKNKGGTPPGNATLPADDSAAIRQAVKAKIAQVRAILPQLRQGAAASVQDRGVVPGLGQYFTQMESNINRMLQVVDACLDTPEHCTISPISCPSPPVMPALNNVGSAAMIRQIQQSYAQAANAAHKACLNLNGEIIGEVKRLKQEARGAATKEGFSVGSKAQQFGDVDLYLKRVESLRREATQYRQEADRISGVSGYCGGRRHSRMDTDTAHALVAAFKGGDKLEKTTDPGLPLDAKVIDLKAGWGSKWDKGKSLRTSDVPLPKLSLGEAGETAPDWDAASSDDNGPSWWDKQKSAYKKADEEMALTEFFTSRPEQMAKFVAKEVVKLRFGGFGESLVNAYTILDAVKTTSDEVGQILVDAPKVIAHGSVSDARELADRADRAPLNLLNSVFDDVADWLPVPQRRNNGGAR